MQPARGPNRKHMVNRKMNYPMKIPKKEELLKLQARYKTNKRIAKALGYSEYLVSCWASMGMTAGKLGIRKCVMPTKALELFGRWNEESAWIFGVLFPKSIISFTPSPRLQFWSTRKSLVKQVSAALGIYRENIVVKFCDTKPLYFVGTSNREFIYKLAQLGLVRLKKRRKFPDIPQKFIWHFLRGFFDCESSIIPSSHRWGVGFARKDVVEEIRDILYKLAGIKNLRTNKPYKIYYSENGHEWYIRIGGINLVKLHEYLYNDIDNIIYNKDKKEQFDKLLEMWQNKTLYPIL